MRSKGYNTIFLALMGALLGALPAQAQYGSGVVQDVPEVAAGAITLDGNPNEAEWADAVELDMTRYWDGAWSGHPVADVTVTARALWSEGVLYLSLRHEDYQELYFPGGGGGEQFLVGVDLTHANDADTTGYDGWPDNAPNLGPVTYKIEHGAGITLNWSEEVSPADSGWVAGETWVDAANFAWGVEMAIYGAQITNNGQIGFNVGGSSGDAAFAEEPGGDGAYAYYSWMVCNTNPPGNEGCYAGPGGNVMSESASFASLRFVSDDGVYGSGVVQDVPEVAAGAITLDGNPNEAEWADAVELDMTRYWDGAWSGHPVADVTVTARALWSEGVLYLSLRHEDYQELYFPGGGGGEQFLVGVDLTHANDADTTGYDGWPDNAPNLGPVTYKIEHGAGITLNWSEEVSPADSGWVAGETWVDAANFAWGVEMAIYGAQITNNGQIGFNVGGSSGDAAFAEEPGGDGAYAYYSWMVCNTNPPGNEGCYAGPGGNVMSESASFASLHFVGGIVANEAGPRPAQAAALRSIFPNPSRGTATIAYELAEAGAVDLVVYDMLGRQVAVLASGAQTAGQHQASLRDDLPAGVYIVRLAVDGRPTATRTIVRAN